MLRLCHDLPRYSLDMDFWFFKETHFENFHGRLEDAVRRDYDVTDLQDKFYSILVELRKTKGTPRLKVEIRKAVSPAGGTEEKIAFSPSFPRQVLVRGFTLKRMCRNKIEALLDRGEIRDAFDLEYMVRRGARLELSKGEREKIVKRLKGFKKRDFDAKLGSLLLPDVRDYYREHRFSYLEEKLSFQPWTA